MQTDRQIRAASLFLSIIFILLCFPHTVGVYAETTEIKYYSVQDYSYEVSLTVLSTWQDHANIDLTISNNGETPIENWYLTFNSPYQIENIWNASVVEADADGTCTIKNAGYNQDIPSNSQVTVGMTLSSVDSEVTEISSWYLLNMKEAEVDEEKYSFTYIEYSSWGTGFSGAFILSSNEIIEDWLVEFESDYQITNVSNAVMYVEDSLYTLKNDGNTQNIYPDNPITISIQGVPTENEILCTYEMKDIVLGYSLDEDSNENGIPDYQDFINEQEGIISVNPTDVPTDTPTITDEPTPTVEEPDYYLDSDEDMLTDYVEEFYGTDKNDPDSDDDNLSDYFEIIMGYDPNNGDSDDNGILDGDEDYDNDGITNSEEIRLGIEPQMEDSDLDELSDYDEIYVYGSDPASEDSNNDGITDGDAVFLGLDPISEDSDGNGIPDNQEKIYQDISTEISEIEAELDVIKEVKVEGDITNRIDTVLTIENVYGKHEYSSDVPAQVGVPINIECESDFGELTVTFYYDETKLGQTNEEDLGIYWVDEETGMLIDIDSEVDEEADTISFVTDHLCDWILIDKKADREFWMGIAKYFNVKTDPAKSVTREGTIYFLAVQFGNLVSDENKTNTMSAIADLMGYIGEEDRVVVYAYNSSNVRDQYNYLIFGDWIEEDGIQVTKFYKKEESGDLLLHLHNLFFGDYKENYYANLMTENGNDGKEIDYENYWYLESNRIEPEKEALASETATNIIHRLFWMHSSCQFRIKLHDSDASSKEKDAYDRSLKEKYSESDDYYFHIKDHENVFVIFANGKQTITTDNESPLEPDGLHYISKADLIENELFIVNTGKTEEKSVLDLNQAMYKVEKGYEYGVWPYTHGCLINMDGTDFGSEFKRMREGLDEDRDGLSDIYEKTGMLGANGKLITSNPDKSDSDGDSLTDGREMGKEYTIVLESVYNKETGKYTSKMEVNGVPVEYGFNGKRYDRFFKYGEGVWTLYSYKSNPELEDTDG
ncbi:MAG: cellulose binding domain-containing protein, partial [Clostridiales bacterium]|nr:cellulose binding domain-containing protein [Clostridiales bacterium]